MIWPEREQEPCIILIEIHQLRRRRDIVAPSNIPMPTFRVHLAGGLVNLMWHLGFLQGARELVSQSHNLAAPMGLHQ
jgi:hypothetical protein